MNAVEDETVAPLALLREAAAIGPGYRGLRREPNAEERRALGEKLGAFGIELSEPTIWIDRRAKLFEAGAYPDKGVTVTEGDLEALVSTFDLPVPVLIEHAASPLELGFLTQIEAVGGELFGTLALSAEAYALVERSGAKSLSIGLSKDLSRIVEVSLVRHPRVVDARMFHGHRFDGAAMDNAESEAAWQKLCGHLERKLDREADERLIESWIREGKILPAQAESAKGLLALQPQVAFSGGPSVRELLDGLLQAAPAPIWRMEPTTEPTQDLSSLLMMPEEAAFYRRYFPEVPLDHIAHLKSH